ncbi:MFS transporter [Salmonella enterica]|nr:MFS transporter [Salmonella enterica]EDW7804599.1 MFS transporter [Salmonella enterica]EJD1073563.1 MFS transporter [Salmonella enterica]EJG8591051.1 MFS transporter [Salmonella enterica]EJG8988484.1 MFS transporter [Salmonella enterica]
MNKLTLSYLNTTFGFWLTSFLVPLLILDLTGSAFIVTASYALNIAPYILITPLAGVIGDSLSRKNIILFGEFACFLLGGLLYLTPYNAHSVWIIIILGFLISSFAAIHHPVFQSIIPDVIQGEKIKDTNANIGVVDSIVGIIAPILLGIMLFQIDKKSVTLVIPLLYLLSFMIFLTIPYQKKVVSEHLTARTAMHSLKEGFVYVGGNKSLRNIAILFFFVNIGIRLILPNLIWIYSKVFLLNDRNIAPYFIIIGVLAITGAKIAPKLIGRFSDISIILTASLMIALCSFALILAHSPVTFSLIWGGSCLVQSVIVVTFFTYRLKITPNHILSRVVSVTRLISYLAIPVAALSGGWSLEKSGNVNLLYILSGLVTMFAVMMFLLLGTRLLKSRALRS